MVNNKLIVRSKAPLRLGLAGGGTDIPDFYKYYNGGCVINISLNLYSYCTIEPLDNPNEVIFSSLDSDILIKTNKTNYIEPEGKLSLHKAVFNRIVKDFNNNQSIGGFQVITKIDVPTGSGLGGSSATIIAMLSAYIALLNLSITPQRLAELAYSIEREDLKLKGGKQDQYCSAYGGLNFMEFLPNEQVEVHPLIIPKWSLLELEHSLILYFTGTKRNSTHIIDQQSTNIQKKINKAPDYLKIIKKETYNMKEGLLTWDINLIINSIKNSWEAKKYSASKISNSDIDNMFNTALEAGAYGGKISGAGGGGFMMLLCDPIKKYSIINKLQKFGGWSVNFSFTSDGPIVWKIKNN